MGVGDSKERIPEAYRPLFDAYKSNPSTNALPDNLIDLVKSTRNYYYPSEHVTDNISVLIVGPDGSGKTSLVNHMRHLYSTGLSEGELLDAIPQQRAQCIYSMHCLAEAIQSHCITLFPQIIVESNIITACQNILIIPPVVTEITPSILSTHLPQLLTYPNLPQVLVSYCTGHTMLSINKLQPRSAQIMDKHYLPSIEDIQLLRFPHSGVMRTTKELVVPREMLRSMSAPTVLSDVFSSSLPVISLANALSEREERPTKEQSLQESHVRYNTPNSTQETSGGQSVIKKSMHMRSFLTHAQARAVYFSQLPLVTQQIFDTMKVDRYIYQRAFAEPYVWRCYLLTQHMPGRVTKAQRLHNDGTASSKLTSLSVADTLERLARLVNRNEMELILLNRQKQLSSSESPSTVIEDSLSLNSLGDIYEYLRYVHQHATPPAIAYYYDRNAQEGLADLRSNLHTTNKQLMNESLHGDSMGGKYPLYASGCSVTRQDPMQVSNSVLSTSRHTQIYKNRWLLDKLSKHQVVQLLHDAQKLHPNQGYLEKSIETIEDLLKNPMQISSGSRMVALEKTQTDLHTRVLQTQSASQHLARAKQHQVLHALISVLNDILSIDILGLHAITQKDSNRPHMKGMLLQNVVVGTDARQEHESHTLVIETIDTQVFRICEAAVVSTIDLRKALYDRLKLETKLLPITTSVQHLLKGDKAVEHACQCRMTGKLHKPDCGSLWTAQKHKGLHVQVMSYITSHTHAHIPTCMLGKQQRSFQPQLADYCWILTLFLSSRVKLLQKMGLLSYWLSVETATQSRKREAFKERKAKKVYASKKASQLAQTLTDQHTQTLVNKTLRKSVFPGQFRDHSEKDAFWSYGVRGGVTAKKLDYTMHALRSALTSKSEESFSPFAKQLLRHYNQPLNMNVVLSQARGKLPTSPLVCHALSQQLDKFSILSSSPCKCVCSCGTMSSTSIAEVSQLMGAATLQHNQLHLFHDSIYHTNQMSEFQEPPDLDQPHQAATFIHFFTLKNTVTRDSKRVGSFSKLTCPIINTFYTSHQYALYVSTQACKPTLYVKNAPLPSSNLVPVCKQCWQPTDKLYKHCDHNQTIGNSLGSHEIKTSIDSLGGRGMQDHGSAHITAYPSEFAVTSSLADLHAVKYRGNMLYTTLTSKITNLLQPVMGLLNSSFAYTNGSHQSTGDITVDVVEEKHPDTSMYVGRDLDQPKYPKSVYQNSTDSNSTQVPPLEQLLAKYPIDEQSDAFQVNMNQLAHASSDVQILALKSVLNTFQNTFSVYQRHLMHHRAVLVSKQTEQKQQNHGNLNSPQIMQVYSVHPPVAKDHLNTVSEPCSIDMQVSNILYGVSDTFTHLVSKPVGLKSALATETVSPILPPLLPAAKRSLYDSFVSPALFPSPGVLPLLDFTGPSGIAALLKMIRGPFEVRLWDTLWLETKKVHIGERVPHPTLSYEQLVGHGVTEAWRSIDFQRTDSVLKLVSLAYKMDQYIGEHDDVFYDKHSPETDRFVKKAAKNLERMKSKFKIVGSATRKQKHFLSKLTGKTEPPKSKVLQSDLVDDVVKKNVTLNTLVDEEEKEAHSARLASALIEMYHINDSMQHHVTASEQYQIVQGWKSHNTDWPIRASVPPGGLVQTSIPEQSAYSGWYVEDSGETVFKEHFDDFATNYNTSTLAPALLQPISSVATRRVHVNTLNDALKRGKASSTVGVDFPTTSTLFAKLVDPSSERVVGSWDGLPVSSSPEMSPSMNNSANYPSVFFPPNIDSNNSHSPLPPPSRLPESPLVPPLSGKESTMGSMFITVPGTVLPNTSENRSLRKKAALRAEAVNAILKKDVKDKEDSDSDNSVASVESLGSQFSVQSAASSIPHLHNDTLKAYDDTVAKPLRLPFPAVPALSTRTHGNILQSVTYTGTVTDVEPLAMAVTMDVSVPGSGTGIPRGLSPQDVVQQQNTYVQNTVIPPDQAVFTTDVQYFGEPMYAYPSNAQYTPEIVTESTLQYRYYPELFHTQLTEHILGNLRSYWQQMLRGDKHAAISSSNFAVKDIQGEDRHLPVSLPNITLGVLLPEQQRVKQKKEGLEQLRIHKDRKMKLAQKLHPLLKDTVITENSAMDVVYDSSVYNVLNSKVSHRVDGQIIPWRYNLTRKEKKNLFFRLFDRISAPTPVTYKKDSLKRIKQYQAWTGPISAAPKPVSKQLVYDTNILTLMRVPEVPVQWSDVDSGNESDSESLSGQATHATSLVAQFSEEEEREESIYDDKEEQVNVPVDADVYTTVVEENIEILSDSVVSQLTDTQSRVDVSEYTSVPRSYFYSFLGEELAALDALQEQNIAFMSVPGKHVGTKRKNSIKQNTPSRQAPTVNSSILKKQPDKRDRQAKETTRVLGDRVPEPIQAVQQGTQIMAVVSNPVTSVSPDVTVQTLNMAEIQQADVLTTVHDQTGFVTQLQQGQIPLYTARKAQKQGPTYFHQKGRTIQFHSKESTMSNNQFADSQAGQRTWKLPSPDLHARKHILDEEYTFLHRREIEGNFTPEEKLVFPTHSIHLAEIVPPDYVKDFKNTFLREQTGASMVFLPTNTDLPLVGRHPAAYYATLPQLPSFNITLQTSAALLHHTLVPLAGGPQTNLTTVSKVNVTPSPMISLETLRLSDLTSLPRKKQLETLELQLQDNKNSAFAQLVLEGRNSKMSNVEIVEELARAFSERKETSSASVTSAMRDSVAAPVLSEEQKSSGTEIMLGPHAMPFDSPLTDLLQFVFSDNISMNILSSGDIFSNYFVKKALHYHIHEVNSALTASTGLQPGQTHAEFSWTRYVEEHPAQQSLESGFNSALLDSVITDSLNVNQQHQVKSHYLVPQDDQDVLACTNTPKIHHLWGNISLHMTVPDELEAENEAGDVIVPTLPNTLQPLGSSMHLNLVEATTANHSVQYQHLMLESQVICYTVNLCDYNELDAETGMNKMQAAVLTFQTLLANKPARIPVVLVQTHSDVFLSRFSTASFTAHHPQFLNMLMKNAHKASGVRGAAGITEAFASIQSLEDSSHLDQDDLCVNSTSTRWKPHVSASYLLGVQRRHRVLGKLKKMTPFHSMTSKGASPQTAEAYKLEQKLVNYLLQEKKFHPKASKPTHIRYKQNTAMPEKDDTIAQGSLDTQIQEALFLVDRVVEDMFSDGDEADTDSCEENVQTSGDQGHYLPANLSVDGLVVKLPQLSMSATQRSQLSWDAWEDNLPLEKFHPSAMSQLRHQTAEQGYLESRGVHVHKRRRSKKKPVIDSTEDKFNRLLTYLLGSSEIVLETSISNVQFTPGDNISGAVAHSNGVPIAWLKKEYGYGALYTHNMPFEEQLDISHLMHNASVPFKSANPNLWNPRTEHNAGELVHHLTRSTKERKKKAVKNVHFGEDLTVTLRDNSLAQSNIQSKWLSKYGSYFHKVYNMPMISSNNVPMNVAAVTGEGAEGFASSSEVSRRFALREDARSGMIMLSFLDRLMILFPTLSKETILKYRGIMRMKQTRLLQYFVLLRDQSLNELVGTEQTLAVHAKDTPVWTVPLGLEDGEEADVEGEDEQQKVPNEQRAPILHALIPSLHSEASSLCSVETVPASFQARFSLVLCSELGGIPLFRSWDQVQILLWQQRADMPLTNCSLTEFSKVCALAPTYRPVRLIRDLSLISQLVLQSNGEENFHWQLLFDGSAAAATLLAPMFLRRGILLGITQPSTHTDSAEIYADATDTYPPLLRPVTSLDWNVRVSCHGVYSKVMSLLSTPYSHHMPISNVAPIYSMVYTLKPELYTIHLQARSSIYSQLLGRSVPLVYKHTQQVPDSVEQLQKLETHPMILILEKQQRQKSSVCLAHNPTSPLITAKQIQAMLRYAETNSKYAQLQSSVWSTGHRVGEAASLVSASVTNIQEATSFLEKVTIVFPRCLSVTGYIRTHPSFPRMQLDIFESVTPAPPVSSPAKQLVPLVRRDLEFQGRVVPFYFALVKDRLCPVQSMVHADTNDFLFSRGIAATLAFQLRLAIPLNAQYLKQTAHLQPAVTHPRKPKSQKSLLPAKDMIPKQRNLGLKTINTRVQLAPDAVYTMLHVNPEQYALFDFLPRLSKSTTTLKEAPLSDSDMASMYGVLGEQLQLPIHNDKATVQTQQYTYLLDGSQGVYIANSKLHNAQELPRKVYPLLRVSLSSVLKTRREAHTVCVRKRLLKRYSAEPAVPQPHLSPPIAYTPIQTHTATLSTLAAWFPSWVPKSTMRFHVRKIYTRVHKKHTIALPPTVEHVPVQKEYIVPCAPIHKEEVHNLIQAFNYAALCEPLPALIAPSYIFHGATSNSTSFGLISRKVSHFHAGSNHVNPQLSVWLTAVDESLRNNIQLPPSQFQANPVPVVYNRGISTTIQTYLHLRGTCFVYTAASVISSTLSSLLGKLAQTLSLAPPSHTIVLPSLQVNLLPSALSLLPNAMKLGRRQLNSQETQSKNTSTGGVSLIAPSLILSHDKLFQGNFTWYVNLYLHERRDFHVPQGSASGSRAGKSTRGSSSVYTGNTRNTNAPYWELVTANLYASMRSDQKQVQRVLLSDRLRNQNYDDDEMLANAIHPLDLYRVCLLMLMDNSTVPNTVHSRRGVQLRRSQVTKKSKQHLKTPGLQSYAQNKQVRDIQDSLSVLVPSCVVPPAPHTLHPQPVTGGALDRFQSEPVQLMQPENLYGKYDNDVSRRLHSSVLLSLNIGGKSVWREIQQLASISTGILKSQQHHVSNMQPATPLTQPTSLYLPIVKPTTCLFPTPQSNISLLATHQFELAQVHPHPLFHTAVDHLSSIRYSSKSTVTGTVTTTNVQSLNTSPYHPEHFAFYSRLLRSLGTIPELQKHTQMAAFAKSQQAFIHKLQIATRTNLANTNSKRGLDQMRPLSRSESRREVSSSNDPHSYSGESSLCSLQPVTNGNITKKQILQCTQQQADVHKLLQLHDSWELERVVSYVYPDAKNPPSIQFHMLSTQMPMFLPKLYVTPTPPISPYLTMLKRSLPNNGGYEYISVHMLHLTISSVTALMNRDYARDTAARAASLAESLAKIDDVNYNFHAGYQDELLTQCANDGVWQQPNPGDIVNIAPSNSPLDAFEKMLTSNIINLNNTLQAESRSSSMSEFRYKEWSYTNTKNSSISPETSVTPETYLDTPQISVYKEMSTNTFVHIDLIPEEPEGDQGITRELNLVHNTTSATSEHTSLHITSKSNETLHLVVTTDMEVSVQPAIQNVNPFGYVVGSIELHENPLHTECNAIDQVNPEIHYLNELPPIEQTTLGPLHTIITPAETNLLERMISQEEAPTDASKPEDISAAIDYIKNLFWSAAPTDTVNLLKRPTIVMNTHDPYDVTLLSCSINQVLEDEYLEEMLTSSLLLQKMEPQYLH